MKIAILLIVVGSILTLDALGRIWIFMTSGPDMFSLGIIWGLAGIFLLYKGCDRYKRAKAPKE